MMHPSIKTPETHPNHHVVGRYFVARAGADIGRTVYFCDSYDPQVDYWMTPITMIAEGASRTAVSPRAIDRTWHTVHDDTGRLSCAWGPLGQQEIDAINAHIAHRMVVGASN